ncbi:exported hypothetical protein [Gammaproteobacteria bacterium]
MFLLPLGCGAVATSTGTAFAVAIIPDVEKFEKYGLAGLVIFCCFVITSTIALLFVRAHIKSYEERDHQLLVLHTELLDMQRISDAQASAFNGTAMEFADNVKEHSKALERVMHEHTATTALVNTEIASIREVLRRCHEHTERIAHVKKAN